MAHQRIDKKKALLDRKDEILKDIKYFENRIEEARSQKTNSSYFYDADEDDDVSSTESLNIPDMGPSLPDLKFEQNLLQTCLNATQELTNLCVLQSEVNVMVADPVYEREPPVTEQGTWREVTADCRVDLVPFSITFYTHQSSRHFGPTSYRGLRVTLVKAAHENELANSILPRISTPSDAVEVLRSYAAAHRSRRTTLARLAEKYSNSLFMEPMADGGYIIKCAKLLEVSWRLENKWSPLASFQHKMKFDLEYMDEMYVKIISQAHRELSDPTLETDERTRLLSKIIATCLEAQGPNQELYESMESDMESENLRKRRTELDEEIDEPVNKKKKDSEMMAPPKSLPKKTKLKGKENNVYNKKEPTGVKRAVTADGSTGAKKIKRTEDDVAENCNVNDKQKVMEVPALKKVTDSKSSKETNPNKKNVDKEVMKSISDNKKNNSDTKQANKENIANTKRHTDKENIVTLKQASNSKGSKVNNNVGTSELGRIKNTEMNLNNATEKPNKVREGAAKKKNDNKQNMKGKSINEKKVTDTDNCDKLLDTKKANKKSETVTNNVQDSDKININNNEAKVNKVLKNKTETNSGGSKKITSSVVQTIESTSGNNKDKPANPKVSSNPTNTANKHDNVAKISDRKTNSKTAPTINRNDNIAISDKILDIDNNKNKKIVVKTKSMEKKSNANPTVSNTENLNKKHKPNSVKNNAKNMNMPDEGNKKSNSNSKESLNDIRTKPKDKSNNENIARSLDCTSKTVNKQLEVEDTKRVSKENPTTSATIHKSAKSSGNTDKTDRQIVNKTNDKRNNANSNSEQNVTQLKVVVKNMNGKTKSNNVTDKIEDNVLSKINSDSNINKPVGSSKILPMGLNQRISTAVDVNRDRLMNQNTNKEKTDDKNSNKNLLKSNFKVKSNSQGLTKNVINNKNLKPSKSPIQNKIKLLNLKTKLSVDKHKLSNNQKEKEKHDKNKIFTKIPQKLMTVREHILKKNPLRISPRKNNSSLTKADSQNSSRSSLRNLQKPMTGIPRLLKKPVSKG